MSRSSASCGVLLQIAVSSLATEVGPNESGGEGRDSNPRMVLPTATNEPAAALSSGDLSESERLLPFELDVLLVDNVAALKQTNCE